MGKRARDRYREMGSLVEVVLGWLWWRLPLRVYCDLFRVLVESTGLFGRIDSAGPVRIEYAEFGLLARWQMQRTGRACAEQYDAMAVKNATV